MKVKFLKTVLIIIILFSFISGGVFARERTHFVVYSNMSSDYARFMSMELKRILFQSLGHRKIRMKQYDLTTLKVAEIGKFDRVLLLLHVRDLNKKIRALIQDTAKDPRIFVWISGDTLVAKWSGVDAVTSASYDWKENEKAAIKYLVPFVRGSERKK